MVRASSSSDPSAARRAWLKNRSAAGAPVEVPCAAPLGYDSTSGAAARARGYKGQNDLGKYYDASEEAWKWRRDMIDPTPNDPDGLSHVSSEEVARLRRSFEALDESGKGYLNTLELRAGLESMGNQPTEEALKVIMEQTCADGKTMRFEEYARMMSHAPGSSFMPYLQGVQHIGMTVKDMDLALQFYCDMLGCRIVKAVNHVAGERFQQTLHQYEETQWKVVQREFGRRYHKLYDFGVPDLKTGEYEFDAIFTAYHNTVVELIQYRASSHEPLSSGDNGDIGQPRAPSSPATIGSFHLSFHIHDDVDVYEFVRDLELEAQARGMEEVIANRVVAVDTFGQRWEVAPEDYYNYLDASAGLFQGWTLFYCKGPSGEQLEFNQVAEVAHMLFNTNKFKQHFRVANLPLVGKRGVRQPLGLALFSHKKRMTPSKLVQGALDQYDGKKGVDIDVDGFLSYLSDNVTYVMGSKESVSGKGSVKSAVERLLDGVKSWEHKFLDLWECGNTVFLDAELNITYEGGTTAIQRLFYIFTVEAGRISKIELFGDSVSAAKPSPDALRHYAEAALAARLG